MPKARQFEFDPKDEPLREDVGRLGAVVGEALREQEGEEFFQRVETARRAAIDRRERERVGSEPDDAETRRLDEVLAGLEVETAAELVRAFSLYFRVVNLAEKVHRIRRRRDYLRDSSGPAQSGSLLDTFQRLQGQLDVEEIEALLSRVLVEPVFTAHPTESTRRAVLEKEQAVVRRLVDLLDPSATLPERAAAWAAIRAEVTAAWQTEESPVHRPSVADEREHVLFFLTDVLYRIIPPLYEEMDQAAERVWGTGALASTLPTVVRFASWVGGDMDGNPNVDAGTFEESLERQRELVLSLFLAEVQRLARRLTQSTSRVEVSKRLSERIERYAETFPETWEGIHQRHRDMPYRVLLILVAERIRRSGVGGSFDQPGGYPGPEALMADLSEIARSLEQHRGVHAGLFQVHRLQRRVETFGFHLATLDVRQDSLVLRTAVARLLGVDVEGWLEAGSESRTERLVDLLGGPELASRESLADGVAGTEKTLEVFRAIGRSRLRHGEAAVGPYIISMCEGADDVLSVLWLARVAGLVETRDDQPIVPLDVCPLFETVPDLEVAAEVVGQLGELELYRAHLGRRSNVQHVMLGYSDSSKDGGVAASRWALQQAQERLASVSRRVGIELVLFHGRGGTVGRGGGRTHRAVLASPPGSLRGKMRVTEQGEVIDEKYGLRGIALRSLERLIGSVALATVDGERQWEQGGEDVPEAWRDVVAEVAEASRRHYRELVWEDPRFTAYFRAATPIDVIERMTIGSRPASRRAGGGVESLRAIPWVFSWTQSRHLVPGWFGLGTGLEAAIERFGEVRVREVANGWPFVRNLLDDVEMAMAKADLGIARRYAALADEASRGLFELILEEFDRTERWILRLKGTHVLLALDPTLRRSIRLRNPYVDPMSLLQIDLLRRWREAERPEGPLLDALLASVHGIAQGLQNTG